MRIDRLDLLAFGPFTDAVLDFSGGAEGLHVVFGPNEAGKSSALRAIQQLFAGIPRQSADDFVHPYKAMKVGARLRDRAGGSLEVVRLKRDKNSLVAPDGRSLDDADAAIGRLLGGMPADEFLKKFVIDHGELVDGGKVVAQGKGDLAQVLFAAGSGLTGLGAVQAALEKEAEELFKRGGSKPQINARLGELDAARKQVKDDTLRSAVWRDHDERLRDALARRRALTDELDDAARRRDRLRRVSDAVDPIARRKAVAGELLGLADAPRLSPDFTYRRRDVQSRIVPDEKAEAAALDRIAGLTAELDALEVPDPLLEQADAIKAMTLRLGSHQKARADRARLEAELARFEAEAGAILRDLGRDPADAGPPRLKAHDRAAVHDLANQRQALLQGRDDARKALDAHDARLQAAAARLAALGPARDPEPLRKAVKRAQAQGDLDDLLARDRDALGRDRTRAEIGLKALGLWSGTLDALEALPVPPAETVERFQSELDAAAREADDLRRRGDDLGAEAAAVDDQLDRLRLDGPVPTEDALAAARAGRDAAWERLRDAWEPRLAPAYERAVRAADEAADRLRREAKRVSDHARLGADRARLTAALDDLDARLGRARARHDGLARRWADLWTPLGVDDPGTPREMLAWVRRRADLAALAASAREKAEAAAAREGQVGRHRRELLAALAPLAENPADPDAPLAALVDRAQEVIDAVAKEQKARDRLRDDVEARRADRPALEAAAASAAAAWDDWRSRWAAAVARIGLAPDALPAEAEAVLNQTAALSDRLDRAAAHRAQVDAIGRESRRFASDVWNLADRVAPDLAVAAFGPEVAEAAAAELADRLGRASAARQRRDDLTARLREAEQARDAAAAELARARGELATLRREARCDADDQLPAVEERSARRQRLEAELTDLNARLLKLAAGSPLEPFLAEAEAEQADPVGLARRAGALDEALAALERERSALDQAIGSGRTLLAQMNGSARAADAGQDAEDLRARIRSDVEQYARLRLASAVLRAGIERYRARAQGPVLARASALFSALTLGSFEGLTVDYDEGDAPVLKGVRPGTRGAVGVPAMSLGTADQLYLALRLATLETYLDRREPLPLVVDDVLIQFDDARASATLSALASFARRTQVLVFTHHEHLLALASKAVPSDLLFTHALPGRV